MTTGERLVEISTLSTGTAMDHFLNISTGVAQEESYSGGGGAVHELMDGNEILEILNSPIEELDFTLHIPDTDIELDTSVEDLDLDLEL